MKRYLPIWIAVVFFLGFCAAYAFQNFESATPTEPTQPLYIAGFLTKGEQTFYQTETGEMHIGWLELEGARYYFDPSGILQTGWLQENGNTYYLDASGKACRGKTEIDGRTHYFASTGAEIIVVNPWNFIPEDYEVDLVEVEDGYTVDRSCLQALLEMLSACRKEGYEVQIVSAYRTHATQVRLFNNRVQRYLNSGYSEEESRKKAATSVAVPGTSEHQTGLAVDLVDADNWALNETQANTPTQKWLMAHCWEYGFILRYPNGKTESTGIIYEPWHYRYVGAELAKEIHKSGLCLEEYFLSLQ